MEKYTLLGKGTKQANLWRNWSALQTSYTANIQHKLL